MIKIDLTLQLDVGDEDRFFSDLRAVSDRLKGEGRPVFWKVTSRLDSEHMGDDEGDTRLQAFAALREASEFGVQSSGSYQPMRIAGRR